MSTDLIRVSNIRTGGSKAQALDVTMNLDEIRNELEKKGLMSPTDYFLLDGKTEVDKEQEGLIPLSSIVKEGLIVIGMPAGIPSAGDGVDAYNAMSGAEQNSLLMNIQIFRGLTITKDKGFVKTFKDLYSWNQSPVANNPRTVSQVQTSYSFNEVTHMLHVFGSDSASVSLNAPFGDAEANFKHEQSKETSSKNVTEYLISRFVLNKVELKTDKNNIICSPAFIGAVENAIADYANGSDTNGITAYSKLLDVLNEWGYYVPLTFTLGGALFSEETTKITEYSSAETEKDEFGGSFKAAFDGIGGGGAYNHASGSDEKTTSSSKYKDTAINQVGGKAGTYADYATWASSLDKWNYWALATALELLPSLYLLSRGDEKAKSTLNKCLTLIDSYNSVGTIQYQQPYLSMKDYSNIIGSMLNPFA